MSYSWGGRCVPGRAPYWRVAFTEDQNPMVDLNAPGALVDEGCHVLESELTKSWWSDAPDGACNALYLDAANAQ